MSKYIHERELGDVYARELEVIAALIEGVHPIGEVKAIGRLEVAQAVEDIVADLAVLREENRKLRDLIKVEKWFAETEAKGGSDE